MKKKDKIYKYISKRIKVDFNVMNKQVFSKTDARNRCKFLHDIEYSNLKKNKSFLWPLYNLVVIDIDELKYEDIEYFRSMSFMYQETTRGLHLFFLIKEPIRSRLGIKKNNIKYDLLTPKFNCTALVNRGIRFIDLKINENYKYVYLEDTPFNIEEKNHKKNDFTDYYKYELKSNFGNKKCDYWYNLFLNDTSVNIMIGITPKLFFSNNGLNDGNYKYLSLYIKRLKKYKLLDNEDQRNAFKKIIFKIYPIENKQIENNAKRLIVLLGDE